MCGLGWKCVGFEAFPRTVQQALREGIQEKKTEKGDRVQAYSASTCWIDRCCHHGQPPTASQHIPVSLVFRLHTRASANCTAPHPQVVNNTCQPRTPAQCSDLVGGTEGVAAARREGVAGRREGHGEGGDHVQHGPGGNTLHKTTAGRTGGGGRKTRKVSASSIKLNAS